MLDQINDIKVSFIVLAHDCEQYLPNCIESLINQTEPSIEIILVDDLSGIETSQICFKYMKIDKRIKVVQTSPKKIPEARNIGLENAEGAWIAFVDSDDWVEYDFAEVLLKKCEILDVDVLRCGHYIETSKGTIIAKGFNEDDFVRRGKDKELFQLDLFTKKYDDELDLYSNYNIGTLWSCIYKRNLIFKNNLKFDKDWLCIEDNIFNLYIYEHARAIGIIKKNLYHLRRTERTNTFRYDFWYKVYQKPLEDIRKFNHSYNKDKRFLEIPTIYEMANAVCCEMRFHIFHKENKDSLRAKYQMFVNIVEDKRNRYLFNNINKYYFPKILKRYFLISIKYKLFFITMFLDFIYKIWGKRVSGFYN